MTTSSSLPRWFRRWRWLAILTLVSVLAAILIALPAAILGYQGASMANIRTLYTNLIASTVILLIGLIIAGIFFGGLALLVGVILFATQGRRSADQRVGWRHFWLPIGAIVVVSAVFVLVLALMGPAIGTIFYTGSGLCSYRTKVVVFEDRNGNGVRDIDEPGVAGATVRVSLNTADYGYPRALPPDPQKTNADGIADMNGSEYSCAYTTPTLANDVYETDRGLLSVTAPEGYTQPVSPITISMRWTVNANVVYVPVRKS